MEIINIEVEKKTEHFGCFLLCLWLISTGVWVNDQKIGSWNASKLALANTDLTDDAGLRFMCMMDGTSTQLGWLSLVLHYFLREYVYLGMHINFGFCTQCTALVHLEMDFLGHDDKMASFCFLGPYSADESGGGSIQKALQLLLVQSRVRLSQWHMFCVVDPCEMSGLTPSEQPASRDGQGRWSVRNLETRLVVSVLADIQTDPGLKTGWLLGSSVVFFFAWHSLYIFGYIFCKYSCL